VPERKAGKLGTCTSDDSNFNFNTRSLRVPKFPGYEQPTWIFGISVQTLFMQNCIAWELLKLFLEWLKKCLKRT